MGIDREFFSDMQEGFVHFQGGKKFIEPGETVTYRSGSYRIAERSICHLQLGGNTNGLHIEANRVPFNKQNCLFLHDTLYYIDLELPAGEQHIEVTLRNMTEEKVSGEFRFRLLDDCSNILTPETTHPLPELSKVDVMRECPDLTNFTPGAGEGFSSVGRFGFTKGDGLLDYSMPGFGIVSRPFISGDPRFRKNMIWHFSLLPEGEKTSFSLHKMYQVPDNEKVQCDWTGVRWSRVCADGSTFTFDYSLLSPALLMETAHNDICISELKQLGFYQKALLPLQDGTHIRSTLNGIDGIIYDRDKDGPLSRNHILLAGNGQFPEVPLALILRESPKRITAVKDVSGREDVLHIQFDSPAQWMMICFPCGTELFEPGEVTEQNMLHWFHRSEKLSHYALARVTECKDYYKASATEVEIVQKCSFRYFKDAFNTQPLPFAPLPPVLTIAADKVKEIRLDENLCTEGLPTKYGYWKGVENSSFVTYTLPVPDTRRDISIPAKEQKKLQALLEKDFDEFLHFHLDAPEVGNPGNYSFIFQYSFVLMVFHLLSEEKKQLLMDVIKDGLKKVCDPDSSYTGPGGKRCYSWYKRKDPLSGLDFYMTYLHVNGISRFADCEKETIENTPELMIETDWGNAMSLYGTFLGTMFTNSWDLVRENWSVFRHAFDYYLHTMDWACMCSAYCENSVSWSDGTNYGGYLGFINMAEILGKEEDLALGRYAYSKMFAMRCGLFHASRYYYSKLMRLPPWDCAKFFHEETDASRAFHAYVRHKIHNDVTSPLYNITTEGHYYEALNAYMTYMKENMVPVLKGFENAYKVKPWEARPEGVEDIYHSTDDGCPGWQEVYSYFILQILLGEKSEDELKDLIDSARRNNRIAREFLGHVQWSKRRVPAEWTYSYLLSTLYGKDQPHLTVWKDITLLKASYPALYIKISGTHPMLEIRSRRSLKVFQNGRELELQKTDRDLYRIYPSENGVIEFSER